MQQLIDALSLAPMQEGVTRLVMIRDMMFYPKSKKNFDYVVNTTYQEACEWCKSDILWCGMFEVLDNRGCCNYWQHMIEK